MDPRFNWNFDLGVRTNETPKRPKLRRTWKRSLEVHTPSFFWVGSEPVKSDFSDRKPSSWDQDFYQWRGKSLKSYCGPLQRPYSGWSEPKSWSAFDPLSGSWVNRSEKILTRVFLIGWRKTRVGQLSNWNPAVLAAVLWTYLVCRLSRTCFYHRIDCWSLDHAMIKLKSSPVATCDMLEILP